MLFGLISWMATQVEYALQSDSIMFSLKLISGLDTLTCIVLLFCIVILMSVQMKVCLFFSMLSLLQRGTQAVLKHLRSRIPRKCLFDEVNSLECFL